MPVDIGLEHFVVLSAVLFGCGVACIVTKRHAVAVLMGVEFILNAANINLIAFHHFRWSGAAVAEAATAGGLPIPVSGGLDGPMFVVFVIVIAAAEAAVALSIFLCFYNNFASVDIEQGRDLRG